MELKARACLVALGMPGLATDSSTVAGATKVAAEEIHRRLTGRPTLHTETFPSPIDT